jgi:hypothetical protein
MFRFYGRDTMFTHLSTIFSNQRFSNCSSAMDVGFEKLETGPI